MKVGQCEIDWGSGGGKTDYSAVKGAHDSLLLRTPTAAAAPFFYHSVRPQSNQPGIQLKKNGQGGIALRAAKDNVEERERRSAYSVIYILSYFSVHFFCLSLHGF